MRPLILASALVGLAALPVAAQVSNPAGMAPATPRSQPGRAAPHEPNTQDRLFIQLVAAGGAAEVEAGQAAERKAASSAVKEFGRRMARDHAKANEQLADLARAAKVPLPEKPDPDAQARRAELDTLSGKAFDLAYMRQQIVDHQKTITLLEWEIGSGQDDALQRYATQTLPGVLEHLEMAQGIVAQLTGAAPQGLAAAATASPPNGAQRSTRDGGLRRSR